MPYEEKDAAQTETDFFKKSGLPMCMGAMDGTHIQSHRPQKLYGKPSIIFKNKHEQFYLVLFIAVDTDGRIIYYDVNHGREVLQIRSSTTEAS